MLDIDATTMLILTGAVIGGVELVKRLFDKDWRAATIIAVAAAIGAAMSFAVGIDWYMGLIVGLSGSGLITGLQHVRLQDIKLA